MRLRVPTKACCLLGKSSERKRKEIEHLPTQEKPTKNIMAIVTSIDLEKIVEMKVTS